MSLFTSFFKGKPPRKESDAPQNPQVGYAKQRRPLANYENELAAQVAMAHPVVARCLTKIASSVSTVEWYAEEDPDVPTNEKAGKSAIKKMNDLLKSPNDSFTSTQLKYWMALNYALFGRVPFKVSVGVENLPIGMYPLAVRFVTTTSNQRGAIVSYNYGFASTEEILPTREKSNGKAYAYEIFTPNIDGSFDMGTNVTVLRSIGLPSRVINLLLQRASDTASGHPNSKYIISSDNRLTGAQRDSVTEHIEHSTPGSDESGNVLFLYGTQVKVDKLDNDLSDIHSKMPSDDMARMIFGAFGIPVSLMGLGAADGAKFAGNYLESRASFWEDTLIPSYLSPIENGLTTGLCPPGMRIRFDRDSIDALAYTRITKAKDLTAVGFLTVDEKRELAGYLPLAAGQVLDKPVTPVATNEPGATANAK